MATKSNIKEASFRIGCGRYLQGDGVLSMIGEEVARLGAHRPYIIGGKTALSLTRETIDRSLAALDMQAIYHTYTHFCCRELCEEIMASDAFRACDIVIGVGGGNVMDAAKYCAVLSGKPILNVPTSSATCAAYTPLSVCYTQEGGTVGSTHHKVEVNCVLVDMEILCRQPVRLLLSGVYDSLAKIYELRQRLLGVSVDDSDIGLYASYRMSEFMTELLLRKLDECCADIQNGRNTKTVYDVVYALIAMTGVISGLARGSNQTAIGHKIYESLRALYPREVYSFLHGEMVAIGLIVQIAYNGDEDADAFAARMRALGMPTTLSEIGVAPTAENKQRLYDTLCKSSAMAGMTAEEQARVWDAFALICH